MARILLIATHGSEDPRAPGWRFCLPQERSKKVTGRS